MSGFVSKVLVQDPFQSECSLLLYKPGSFSLDEVIMNQEIQFFQGLGYEDWFGPCEVLPTEVKKIHIDIHAILSAVSQEERRNIFGEIAVFVLFFTCVIAFCR